MVGFSKQVFLNESFRRLWMDIKGPLDAGLWGGGTQICRT